MSSSDLWVHQVYIYAYTHVDEHSLQKINLFKKNSNRIGYGSVWGNGTGPRLQSETSLEPWRGQICSFVSTVT